MSLFSAFIYRLIFISIMLFPFGLLDISHHCEEHVFCTLHQ